MVYLQRDASSEHSKTLRKKAGEYLADLREGAELTQRELAEALSLDYYTFISQLENGQGRLPPNLIIPFAEVVGADPKDVAWEIVKFYDPHLYQALTYEGSPVPREAAG